ncbi:MAG: FtsX-like permease family protein [Syntrophomonadaceae bacterium]|nr:FtsX-like permease family protein [Syntrophomonadaceae bacterium]
MNHYLALVPKYLAAHRKKTRLVIISVAISVALITGVFSMLDVFFQFEKIQVIHDYGNYHIAVLDASEQETQTINSRIDVQNSGTWRTLGSARLNGVTCELGALDQQFAGNLNVELIQGHYPTDRNEIMLEQWAAQSRQLNLVIGDHVQLSFPDGLEKEFRVSGLYRDLGVMKAQGIPGVFLSVNGTHDLQRAEKSIFLIEFKNGVNIRKAEQEIKADLGITEDRIDRNNHLLALMGQSDHNAVLDFYKVGAVLFALVLIAGVLMIYNTFNISVMERVRQFGMLRCIGTSQTQIKKLVRREGLAITLRAIPIGVLAGMVMTLICCAILKYYNHSLFGTIPLLNFSLVGISAGIGIGFLTVLIASFLPARKAARVSPINAVTGSNEIKTPDQKKPGWLMRRFKVEIAMGINNAWQTRRTFWLMASSIAISIILFMGFQVFVDFLYTGLKTTKPYTPDLSLTSAQGLPSDLSARLGNVEGVDRVYGRMFAHVEATFEADKLTDSYKESINRIETKENGLLVPLERSWLISYDKQQMKWARSDLIDGVFTEEQLNQNQGIIAVALNQRNNASTETANWQVGDKVYLETRDGTKEFTVVGVLRSVPFNDSEFNLATFITSEKLFTEITGQNAYDCLDLQISGQNQEKTVQGIKSLLSEDITFLDARQRNAEVNQAFITMAVFIYGFLAVIALISIINIFNTMSTSVVAKTRYLGLMRAIGMSWRQLCRMVLAESATYSLTGSVIGCFLGVVLQRFLINSWLVSFHVLWHFPLGQLIGIAIFISVITVLSVIGPLKKTKKMAVAEVVQAF